MKTMFSMGFGQDIFGSRAMNPTLGLMRPAPHRQLGDTLSGDDLQKQLQSADMKVAAARKFAADHPDQDAALGNDYVMWNTWMPTVDSAGVIVSDVEERLAGIGPGGQIEVTSEEYGILKNYMEAAEVLYQIVARHQTAPRPLVQKTGPARTPAAPVPAPKAAGNDLTAPLLVGGGVLAIGVIALLARA